MSDDLVLVTGASGYIATHIIQQLQQSGYRVRGTVRSLNNEEKVKPLKELCPDATHPLELVEADLQNVECWESAVKDCTYIFHVASPFPAESPRDDSEVIKPAVDGTLNVLKACKEAKTVKRVVLTSSIAAIGESDFKKKDAFTEDDWTDVNVQGVPVYQKSKTLAEKAAWDFIKELSEDEKFELAVVNPGFVIGPVLCGPLTTSMKIPKRLLEHGMPLLPKLNFAMVDVRDVAAGHIAAMTAEGAAGHRHILTTDNRWVKDLAEIIHKEFKDQGYKIPRTEAPYAFMWLYGIFDKGANLILPNLSRVSKYDNTRMKSVLRIEPRDINTTIIEMCYSMIESGKVKKTTLYKGPQHSRDKTQPEGAEKTAEHSRDETQPEGAEKTTEHSRDETQQEEAEKTTGNNEPSTE